MCKTKFLQVCSFSIILTSLHSLNLPFLNGNLLFHNYFIPTATPKLPPRFSTSPPWFPAFPPRLQTKLLRK